MTEYDRDNLDYELDDISDRLEELKEDEKEYGRFISDDLEILSDYYDLMEDEGLTKAEFNRYKAQCIHRLKTKKYVSAPDVNAKALKFAHNLCKLGCLTKEEYEMVKHRMEQLSLGEKQSTVLSDKDYNLHYKSSERNAETRGAKLFAELKDLFKSKKKGTIDEEKYLSEKERIIEKIIKSNDTLQSDTYKYASELSLMGAITSDEYERIIQDSMDDRLNNAPINTAEERRIRDLRNFIEQEKEEYDEEEYERNREARNERLAYLWELIKVVLYIVSIPFRIILWLSEVCLFGYKEVWKRDEMERIMRERDRD